MILSVSRRTDIPAFYADWFYQRLEAGEVFTVNPYNSKQVRRVSLAKGEADGFVFWSKYPAPMLPKLGLLEEFAYYFQFTLTPYGKSLEPGLPALEERLACLQKLAKAAGGQRVVWRYDPLLFGGDYTPQWHGRQFAALAHKLEGLVDTCVFSFYDSYACSDRLVSPLGLRPPVANEMLETAGLFARTAEQSGLRLETCCEEVELAPFGIAHGKCIDKNRLMLLGAKNSVVKKDKNQRKACGCDASVDIGAYNTCPGGCRYCYATRHKTQAAVFYQTFNQRAEQAMAKGRIAL